MQCINFLPDVVHSASLTYQCTIFFPLFLIPIRVQCIASSYNLFSYISIFFKNNFQDQFCCPHFCDACVCIVDYISLPFIRTMTNGRRLFFGTCWPFCLFLSISICLPRCLGGKQKDGIGRRPNAR